MTQVPARTDKIVIVDDDARIRDLLRRYLTQEGFEVIVAEDGKALNRILLRDTVDLIVLDLMMPGEDGLSVCRRLRAANDRTPIIMLTAKGEDVDRIVGLEVGADDYLGKPFNPRELLARVHAVLRRRPPLEAPGAPSTENETVTFGPFAFHLGSRTLKKEGEERSLTTERSSGSNTEGPRWPSRTDCPRSCAPTESSFSKTAESSSRAIAPRCSNGRSRPTRATSSTRCRAWTRRSDPV